MTTFHINAKIRATAIIILCSGLCAVLPVKAQAAEESGVNFARHYHEDNVNMTLQGTGLKRVVFFKAFVAGLYKDPLNSADILGEVSKRIEVEYFVNIPGKKLSQFTVDTMKDNISKEKFLEIINEVALMNDYFVDLKPGDRFSLTYIPKVGTKFAHNGQITGIIEGRDFARALFSVWLGERPFDADLKKQILGIENNRNKQGGPGSRDEK